MSTTDDHLWGEVLGCATEAVRLLPVLLHDLGEAEVGEHDVPVIIQQNVFWLQIAVDDI